MCALSGWGREGWVVRVGGGGSRTMGIRVRSYFGSFFRVAFYVNLVAVLPLHPLLRLDGSES